MRGSKARMMKKFIYRTLEDLDHTDIDHSVFQGVFKRDEKGEVVEFIRPTTMKYPRGHVRRAYQDLKKKYLATPSTGRFVRP